MTPNSDPPLSDETHDAAEDYEKPRPQDVGCSPCRLEHYDEYDGTHCENY
jgi:hypothetical protein